MIIALNNKCNLDKEEFIKYTDELETINSNHEIIVCPSTINIPMFNNYKLKLGSQNVAEVLPNYSVLAGKTRIILT